MKFLYNACAIDNTMLLYALNELNLAAPKSKVKQKQIMDSFKAYLATNPNAQIIFRVSGM